MFKYLLLILLLINTVVYAQKSKDFLDPSYTQDLYYLCKAYKHTAENDSVSYLELAKGFRCFGYIKGYLDGYNAFFMKATEPSQPLSNTNLKNENKIIGQTLLKTAICLPKNVSFNELIYIFIQYVSQHPETFSLDSADVLAKIYVKKFPC